VGVYLIPKEWIELALSSYNKEVGTSLDPLIIDKAKAAYIKRMKE
jgi:hypothetical protein